MLGGQGRFRGRRRRCGPIFRFWRIFCPFLAFFGKILPPKYHTEPLWEHNKSVPFFSPPPASWRRPPVAAGHPNFPPGAGDAGPGQLAKIS